MTDYIVIVALGALVVLLLTELVTAALPVVIVIAMVPPEEREGLAKLLAACDSSSKLRLWPALRLAVRARREEARRARTGNWGRPEGAAPTAAPRWGAVLSPPVPPEARAASAAVPPGGRRTAGSTRRRVGT